MFLLAFVLVFLTGCSGNASDTASDTSSTDPGQPDIIVIFSDDHRFDMLGVAGNGLIHTPVFDRLAKEGVYFVNAITHVSQCGPARAMMVSGLTPDQSGYLSIDIQRSGMDAPDAFSQMPTLPTLLADAGYRTALVGKWHMKNDPWLCGFEHIGLWFDGGYTDFFDPHLPRGRTRETELVEGHITQLFIDDAIRVLDERPEDGRPLYMWLCLTAPHEPFGPSPEHIEALYADYNDDDLMPEGIPRPASPRFRDKWRDYYGSITTMDEQIGRLIEAVNRSPRSKNTVVVYLSDNGFMMGRRGIDSKVCTYEDSIRIPMMIRAPMLGGPVGRTPGQVTSLDVPATVLGLAGVKKPENWAGRDLTEVLSGAAAAPDASVAMWAEGESRLWGRYSSRVYRTDTYKLIVFEHTDQPDELYHLVNDPHETINLAGEPAHSRAYETSKALLHEWLRTYEDSALAWPGKW